MPEMVAMPPIAPGGRAEDEVVAIQREHGEATALSFQKDERIVLALESDVNGMDGCHALRDGISDQGTRDTFVHQYARH